MIMDMATGNRLDAFGAFEEEVLNASGLPSAVLEQLSLQLATVGSARRSQPEPDPDSFLASIYRNQE